MHYCRVCGLKNGYAPEPVQLIGSNSDELERTEPGRMVAEWSVPFPNGLPLGRSIVLRGRPGAGKSRIAYRLASQLGVSMVFALEMGKKLSRETAASAGARLAPLFWYDDVGGMWDARYLKPACIVVDSVQKIGQGWRSFVRELRESWAPKNDGIVIIVSQMNVKGASRFSEDADFDCDIVIDVSPTIDKEKKRREGVHGFDSDPTQCLEGCAHLSIAKSRGSPLVAFDVPIIAK